MYIVNKEDKSMVKVNSCTFSSQDLTERYDLQEWIRKEPSSLGEELLIIQKEFNGFDGTKERLDLLALDKKGNLVIIENKLDDSGTDVNWQAIKYASYCSSLSKQDVIDIFQDYLKKQGDNRSANEILSEFFEKDIDIVEINKGFSQRIFLVAANFRKEVTSSVLWLQNFNLRIKCFKVTLYKYDNQIMVDFDQIIPVEDTEEYRIKIANKELVESGSEESANNRKLLQQKFWGEFIEHNKNNNGLYNQNDATTENWLGKSVSKIKGTTISVNITKTNCRVELYINTGDKALNKKIFDELANHKDEINNKLPNLDWQRNDDGVTCKICIKKDYSYLDETKKTEIFDFFVNTSNKMMEVFSEYPIKE